MSACSVHQACPSLQQQLHAHVCAWAHQQPSSEPLVAHAYRHPLCNCTVCCRLYADLTASASCMSFSTAHQSIQSACLCNLTTPHQINIPFFLQHFFFKIPFKPGCHSADCTQGQLSSRRRNRSHQHAECGGGDHQPGNGRQRQAGRLPHSPHRLERQRHALSLCQRQAHGCGCEWTGDVLRLG